MKNIKNIIFDLGNVIIDLDIERTFLQLEHYLGENYRTTLHQLYPNGDLFNDFETGKITEDEFLGTLKASTQNLVSVRQLCEAWNSMLLSIPAHRFELFKKLKAEGYRLFVLSNTNVTHLEWVFNYCSIVHEVHDFDAFFEKAYYSHLVGMRKPDAEIYEFVLQDSHLKAEETLFIDDNEANALAARSLGIAVIHHPIGAEVAEIFKEVLQ